MALGGLGGGSRSKDITTTTLSEPPEFLRGPLTTGVTAAESQFEGSQGGPGSQLVGQSQDLISQTLQGDFLDPNTNPYLQSTFNRAADLTRGRLDTEFSGAGRNLGAAFPARSEELQTLASNIFGGNFQAERDRQQNVLGQAQGFDPLNRFINQLGGIIPGAGGVTSTTQPIFKQGLF